MAGITFQNDYWLADAINASNLDFSGGTSPKAVLAAEQVKLLRAKRAAEEQALEEQNARLRGMRDLTAAYEKTLPQYGPTTELTTALPSVDDSGQWSTAPQSFEIPQTWTDPAGAQQFTNKRDLALQLFRQGALVGKTTGDIAKMPALMAQSNVLMNGVPADQAQREALQFATTDKFPDEGKPHLQNWYIKDATGKIVGQGTMAGINDVQTSRPVRDLVQPGQTLQIGSPITAEAAGPVGDQKARLNTISQAVNDQATGKPIANPRDVALAIGLEYPQSQKVITDAAGNHFPGAFDGKLIPPVLQPLVNQLNQQLYPSASMGAPTTAPVPFAGPSGPAAAAVPPAQPAAAAPPLVPPGAVAQTGTPPGFQTQAPSTQSQQQMATRVAQASQARQQLEEIILKDPATGQQRTAPYVPGLAPSMLNQGANESVLGRYAIKKLDPVAEQYFASAQRWIEPVLRIASGAAIRPEEYGSYFRMFVPEVGDPPQVISQKLLSMRQWETATGNASTANEALAMMQRAAQQSGDPRTMATIERIRTIATERGTLNNPVTDPAQGAAPAPSGVDHNRVRQLLGMQ
ncbi:hypothetical protein ABIG06_006237 [Bradyrhizobium sp. USDA 326]|uniref:hypothetical protein n=1 Tax=unclassified Bradyrhizobium TaxID=2631580 RepID=UPI003513C1B4